MSIATSNIQYPCVEVFYDLAQVFGIFILTVSAAEASVGLAILIAVYRSRASVDMERFNLLKF